MKSQIDYSSKSMAIKLSQIKIINKDCTRDLIYK